MAWWIFFMANAFAFEENAYFGWNMFPKSDAELIADGLVFLLFALAIVARRT